MKTETILQALLTIFKNRMQAMNPVLGDSEQRAYRRGYESALEKCIEDVVEAQAKTAPTDRKIVQISESDGKAWSITALCNDGTLWRLHLNHKWKLIDGIPQGDALNEVHAGCNWQDC